MTAINAVLKKDKGILMTDAAMYTSQGLVVAFGQKAIALPSMNAAIACRGAQKLSALLAMDLSLAYASFDELLDAGSDAFHRWASTISEALTVAGDVSTVESLHDVQMVVIGWSDKRREAVGFYYDTTSPERFQAIEEYAFGPVPDDEEDANLHILGCEMDVDIDNRSFHPIRHGIPLMEAQRRMKIVPTGTYLDEPISIVGGHILLTEVTSEGVSQRVVHRWNDEVGENIEPEPFKAPAPASRAERRRRERIGH